MRILVVDDETMISQLVEVVLVTKGVEVVSAATMAEARARLHDPEEVFDAILVDLSLPDGDGEELIDELERGDRRFTRIVVFSAVDPHRIRRAARRHGISWVPKPFEPAALRRALGLDIVAA